MDTVVVKTTRGHPAVWERGGGHRNSGRAVIIATENGEAPIATHVRTGGELACSNHALVIVQKGFYLVDATHQRGDFVITISRLEDLIGVAGEFHAKWEEVTTFANGEWDRDLSPFLNAAVEAAKAKAKDYHCRRPFYVREKPKQDDSKEEPSG